MEEWSEKIDVCLCVGTSLSGMADDSYVAKSSAMRGVRDLNNLRNSKDNIQIEDSDSDYENSDLHETYRKSGLIIIGLQPTRMDSISAIKIWGKLDDILF